MVVDPGVLEKFGHQVWTEYVREVGLLVGDFCGSLRSNQAGYLRPSGRMDIKRGRTEGRDVNYKSLGILIQRRFSEFFLIDEFYPLGGW